MTSTREPLTTDWATDADLGALIGIQRNAFRSERFESVFPPTEAGRRWLEPNYRRCVNPSSSSSTDEHWPETVVRVVRDADGVPFAQCILRVFKDGPDPAPRSWRVRWGPSDGDPDTSPAHMADFFKEMERNHEYVMGARGHAFLEMLACRDTHRKRGAGGALVRWAAAYADERGLDTYLDASPAGKPLYESNGYVVPDVSAVDPSPRSIPMVRPTKAGVVGGEGSGSGE